MPRKPKENYFQVSGRPHVGLSDPARFGMTYDEVVRLIDSGKWRTFYKNFVKKEKKQKTIEELQFICPLCGKEETDFDRWKNDCSSCLTCVEEESKRLGKERGMKGLEAPSKPQSNKPSFFCISCKRWKVSISCIGSVVICTDCLRKL